jgi:hypothetical protein
MCSVYFYNKNDEKMGTVANYESATIPPVGAIVTISEPGQARRVCIVRSHGFDVASGKLRSVNIGVEFKDD